MSAKVDMNHTSSRIPDATGRVENPAKRVENVGTTCGREADLSVAQPLPRQLALNESAFCGGVSSEGRTAGTDTALVAHETPLKTNGADLSMPVSKRTRYEVLKRDNHTCRYCGATAPEATLTVDHVVPTALGGSDKPENLVAACRDCNYGKASTSPDDALVQQVGEDDIRWAQAVKRAADAALMEYDERVNRHSWFLTAWCGWNPDQNYLPNGWEKSIDFWIGAGLPQELLLEALDIALGNRKVDHRDVFAYMGGIARSRIEQLHNAAKALLDAEEVVDAT